MDSLFVRGSWIKMDQHGKNKVSLERSKENMWLCCIFIAFHPSGARKKTGTHLQDLRIALKRLIHGISVEVQTKSNKNFISFTVNWLTTVNTSTRTTQVYHVGSLLAAREPQEWKLQNLQFRMAEDWSILMCPCNATSSNTFDSLAYTVNIPDPRRVAKLQRKFRILTKYKII